MREIYSGYRLTLGALVAAIAVSIALIPASSGKEPDKVSVGKNPGQTKGRWLEVESVEKLKQYTVVSLGEITTDIVYKKKDKETPIDEELLNDKIKEHFLARLKESGLFEEVLEQPLVETTAGILRLDCDLMVEAGSRVARYFVGMGAGKSKSILKIHLRDHETGQDLGLYHGYGTGTGMGFKVGGGGARKMTQDDIQENAKKFTELLQEVLSPPHAQ